MCICMSLCKHSFHVHKSHARKHICYMTVCMCAVHTYIAVQTLSIHAHIHAYSQSHFEYKTSQATSCQHSKSHFVHIHTQMTHSTCIHTYTHIAHIHTYSHLECHSLQALTSRRIENLQNVVSFAAYNYSVITSRPQACN
jgi:hypothetical protein